MFRKSLFVDAAPAVLMALFAIGCDTGSSNEGNLCDPNNQGGCGSGLLCYVPPNCTSAICCPPQEMSNPVCFCASLDAGMDAEDASR